MLSFDPEYGEKRVVLDEEKDLVQICLPITITRGDARKRWKKFTGRERKRECVAFSKLNLLWYVTK